MKFSNFIGACVLFVCCFSTIVISAPSNLPPRQMEYLNRSPVAVKITAGVFLSWRLLGNDDPAVYFKIFRNNELIKTGTPTEATNFIDIGGTLRSQYKIHAFVGEQLIDTSSQITPWEKQYKTIQLNRPPAGLTPPNVEHGGTRNDSDINHPNGQSYTYTPNDCSVADLDGDGEYEIIVKWDPSNSKDNSQTGITGNVYLDAYKLDGTMLWRIDLGRNVRAGAHYTQFLVYDFDGDGKAEMVCRTAPGTIDGKGNYVLLGNDDPEADYRNLNLSTSGNSRTGFVLKGSEYVTLFDGLTGEELHSLPFSPARGSVSDWGDSYGNRVDRFLACVAYLDGIHPSAVMCRGYYAKSMLTAYDVVDKQLVHRWTYDSGKSAGTNNIFGQGNHNLSVADVDGDGKDDIIYGSAVISSDGTMLYRTGLGHGDAMHVSDMDPDRPGLEVWTVHEDTGSAYGYELHDAATGEILWGKKTSSDVGRGLAADIDKNHRGFEMWSTADNGVYNVKGEQISTKRPSVNFRIYWDGDLQDELLDGTAVTKWNENGTSNVVNFNSLYPGGVSKINSTKSNPCITADILGDWREEAVYYSTADPSKIVLFTTTTTSPNRLFTLMHDPVYRLAIAWQNVAYNQPPHLGFYIGDGLQDISYPNIYTPEFTSTKLESVYTKQKYQPTLILKNHQLHITNSSNNRLKAIYIYNIIGELLYMDSNIYSTEYICHTNNLQGIAVIRIISEDGLWTGKLIIRD